MNDKRIVVTGIGVVSAFGVGKENIWSALINSNSTINQNTRFKEQGYRSSLAGDVDHKKVEEFKQLLIKKGCKESLNDKALIYALLALEDAFEDGEIKAEDLDLDRVACSIGTLCSGSDYVEQRFREIEESTFDLSQEELLSTYLEIVKNDSIIDEQENVTSAPAILLDKVISHFNFRGPSNMISTACSSSTDSIGWACDQIKMGLSDFAVAGGSDVLSEVVHVGFCSVFNVTKNKPKPFQEDRDGFYIGEGSAFLLLETYESAMARNAKVYAEIKGYGISNSGYHITSTSKDGYGEGLSIVRALNEAQVNAEEIDYINVHGTATKSNDETEATIIKKMYGTGEQPLISSIKPNIGHCMGAAGAIEAVVTIMCLKNKMVPPMINIDKDMQDLNLVINEPKEFDGKYALSTSFGFGGACSAIVIASV